MVHSTALHNQGSVPDEQGNEKPLRVSNYPVSWFQFPLFVLAVSFWITSVALARAFCSFLTQKGSIRYDVGKRVGENEL